MLRTRLALLGAAALLGACGGERSPDAVAKAYVGGKDPAKCEDASLAFLERQRRRRGAAARAAGREAVKRFDPPAGVEVKGITRRGDRARVVLQAGGQEVVVRLERPDDRWLVAGFGR